MYQEAVKAARASHLKASSLLASALRYALKFAAFEAFENLSRRGHLMCARRVSRRTRRERVIRTSMLNLRTIGPKPLARSFIRISLHDLGSRARVV